MLSDQNQRDEPELKIDALAEALTVFKDDILSDIYVGWTKGYLDAERTKFEAALSDASSLADCGAEY